MENRFAAVAEVALCACALIIFALLGVSCSPQPDFIRDATYEPASGKHDDRDNTNSVLPTPDVFNR